MYSHQTEYLHLLSETKVQSGVWIFAGPMSDNMLAIVNSNIEEHNKNAFFYLVYSTDKSTGEHTTGGGDSLTWMQVRLNGTIF